MLDLSLNISETKLDVTLDNTIVLIALVLCLNEDVPLLDRARARSGTSLSANDDGK